ncbi:LptA/OstA family protein [Phenylobacterium sp.]|uniref:LptA/OstA family protein n=1 Tax=Phenylobacterium sp. TaxID=1871053 RepID=UPI002CACC056|nr:LptA/OstA family protein [Phenylobacterium sp.]HLZ76655.1 LptA/OstA family protein [Phenylobacterium sp.]
MKSLIAMAAPAAALVAALAAHGAAAQAPAAQPAKAAKAPVDIRSDSAESRSSDCTAIWSGSAEALQDTSRLRADVMITHQEILQKQKAPAGAASGPGNACGDTVSLEAKGNVYYAAADGRRVHGDNAFYDYGTTTITITGDVTAVDGQNVMRGTKMVYNTQTGEGHMEGSGKGSAAKNRPRGVFYPKDAATDASATGAAPGAATGEAAPAKPKKKKATQ